MKKNFQFAFLLFLVLNMAEVSAKCTCYANVIGYHNGVSWPFGYGFSYNSNTYSFQIFPGDSVVMEANAGFCGSPYHWIYNGDTVFTDTNYPSHYTAHDTGTYQILLLCENGPSYIAKTILTYNEETSIESIAFPVLFNISPNPFTNSFSLEIKTTKTSHLSYQIYDCTGRELKKVNKENIFGDLNLTENFEAMSKGIYFLRVEIGEAIFEKKLLHF